MTTTEETAPSQVTDRIQRITMPKWGLSMESGKVTDWFVAEGDELSEARTSARSTPTRSPALWNPPGRARCARSSWTRWSTCRWAAPSPCWPTRTCPRTSRRRARPGPGAAGLRRHRRRLRAALGTVEVDGVTIAYAVLEPEEPTTAAPVVFVHGYGGDKDSWMFVQEPISAHHATYAIDLPGHGASGKDVGAGTVESLAATVIGLLDALDLSGVHLVGHSMGGAVVTAVAGDPAAAGRVLSLTLVSPAGFGPEINAGYIRGFASAQTRRELKPHLVQLFADQSLVQRQLIDDLLKYKRIDGVDAALATLAGSLLDGDGSGVDVTAAQPRSVGHRGGLGCRGPDRAGIQRRRAGRPGHRAGGRGGRAHGPHGKSRTRSSRRSSRRSGRPAAAPDRAGAPDDTGRPERGCARPRSGRPVAYPGPAPGRPDVAPYSSSVDNADPHRPFDPPGPRRSPPPWPGRCSRPDAGTSSPRPRSPPAPAARCRSRRSPRTRPARSPGGRRAVGAGPRPG